MPIELQLSDNQRRALEEMARTVDDNIVGADRIPSFNQARDSLASKRFDYAGNPVEYMEDLVADRIFPTWPRPGEAAVRCISDFLDEPKGVDPSSGSAACHLEKVILVRACDAEWYKICKEGHRRGMFCMVDDKDVPRDRAGHLVVNGAGGVKKVKVVDRRETQLQRLIHFGVDTDK